MLRLMIVDDEKIIRDGLSSMIDYKRLGYELIATAQNGVEAYDIICDEYPDVVITDIRMPILSGLELVERAVKSDSQITFILLSGYGDFEYARQAMQYGVRHYLLKPTDKNELIEVLTSISSERQKLSLEKKEAHDRNMAELKALLEYHFLSDALTGTEPFGRIFQRYQMWFSFPDGLSSACICSFVEETLLSGFISDAIQILKHLGTALFFPVLYVRNSVVLLYSCHSLSSQDQIRESFEQLHYKGQRIAFSCAFLHAASCEDLFQEVFQKVSRFERILILADGRDLQEYHNDPAAPWKIEALCTNLVEKKDLTPWPEIQKQLFPETLSLESARSIALKLFIKRNSVRKEYFLEYAGDFFHCLYSCQNLGEIRELAKVMLFQEQDTQTAVSVSANVMLIKDYIAKHISSEHLSLKWLAENYLFASVRYLGKQFLQETGVRFSDYLNQVRMEEAKRLMAFYKNDNIKLIAGQVGFGNNPAYFSQVFKRYIGVTPTEYVKRCNIPSHSDS